MRILFITSNRIGDAVLTTGVLAWLVERYPGAQFTIACGPVAVDLFRAVPGLERLIVMPKKKWNGHWLRLWRDCRGIHWDLIVDNRNSVVSRLLGADERAYRPLLHAGQHKVLVNAAMLGLDPPPPPTIWTDAKADETAARIVPESRAVLALGPSANWPAKQWPAERFAELALRLTAGNGPLPGARVLIASAKHERPQLAALFNALPDAQIVDAIGYDLLTVAACFRRCRLFIGNDSGLTHVAAAVHVPTLALFGLGNPAVYRPWGSHTAFVQTDESAEELRAQLTGDDGVVPCLMEGLSVDTVYEAARKLAGKNK